MSGVVFRNAERRDVPAVVRLLADDALGAAREKATDPLPDSYYRAFDAMAAQTGNALIVGEQDGQVVACLQLSIVPGLSRQGQARATIEAVRVARTLRSQGIGERLVRFGIERARAGGAGIVQLTTDKSRKDAHRFYARLGFKASHEGMKLDLSR